MRRAELIDALAGRHFRPLLQCLPTWTLRRLRDPALVPEAEAEAALAAMDEDLVKVVGRRGVLRERAELSYRLPGECGGHSVYSLRFSDGAAYVGRTARLIFTRLEEHLGAPGARGDPTPSIWGRIEAGAGNALHPDSVWSVSLIGLVADH